MNSINIFSDYHHGNLYRSLYLLFQKRLGYNLFRPIGMQWAAQGWWRVAEPYGNAEDTIGQYLDINNRHWDSFKNLNGDYKLEDDIYHVYDPENKFTHSAITLEQFKKMKFDFIIASHPLHGNWKQLLQYQPQAKFIQQLGNENQTTDAKNVLSSVWNYAPLEGQNVLYYHQEFEDLGYTPPTNHNTINSFIINMSDADMFAIYKSNLPEFTMKAYGVGSPDGPVEDLIQSMRDSAFGYHIKPWDGYGHLIHTWAMLGRPVIVKGDWYKGKTAGLLLEDGITCIDLDKRSMQDNLKVIRHFSQPSRHKVMCDNMRKRFTAVCNFDKEAKDIEKWLEII